MKRARFEQAIEEANEVDAQNTILKEELELSNAALLRATTELAREKWVRKHLGKMVSAMIKRYRELDPEAADKMTRLVRSIYAVDLDDTEGIIFAEEKCKRG